MTKEELIGNQKKVIRRLWLLLGVLLPAMIGLSVWIESSFTIPRDQALSFSLIAIFIVFFGGVLWIGKTTDLRCPACKKSLQGGIYTPVAIATGKCGHCGATLFENQKAEQCVAPYVAQSAPSGER